MEQWILWAPEPSFSFKHAVKELSYKNNLLSLLCKNTHSKAVFRLIYKNPLFYQYTNESLWLCTPAEASNDHPVPLTGYTFFTVKNSNLIKWLASENENLQIDNLIHFVCIEIDSYVEIITPLLPTIEWINNV